SSKSLVPPSGIPSLSRIRPRMVFACWLCSSVGPWAAVRRLLSPRWFGAWPPTWLFVVVEVMAAGVAWGMSATTRGVRAPAPGPKAQEERPSAVAILKFIVVIALIPGATGVAPRAKTSADAALPAAYRNPARAVA